MLFRSAAKNYPFVLLHINGADEAAHRKNQSRKKSGKILGSITEQGLVPSRARRECVNPVLNDVVEVGAVNYIYQRTEWMRSRLQKYFPDLWEHIYAASVIRAIYDCRFRRLQPHYEDSILSYLYPGLSFMPNAVTEFLNTLGRMRGAIRSYMQEMVAEIGRASCRERV